MGKYTEFLYLNEEEVIKAGALDYARCIDVEEEIFKLLSTGDYVMGGDNHNSHGITVKFPKESPFPNMPLDGPDRRFMAMPAYVGGRFNVAGQKWYGSNIINPTRGLPRSILMIMLNDPDTCEPIALMSGNVISSVRTGCVPAVGTRYLARKDASVCSCVGAGPIGKACFEAIRLEAKNLKELVVCDLFLEKAPEGIDVAEIKEHVEEIDGVIDAHHIHVWSLDGQLNYATLHAVTSEDHHKIKHKIREELAEHGISHVTIELESEGEHCHETDCHVEHHSCSGHHHHHHGHGHHDHGHTHHKQGHHHHH